MTIEEQLNAINKTFIKLHNDFVNIDAQKDKLKSKLLSEQSIILSEYAKSRSDLSVLKENVLTYYRIAKDNSTKELKTHGVSAACPDTALLNDMIDKINQYNENDPVAGKIIDLTSSYIAYIDNKINAIASEKAALKKASDNLIRENAELAQQKKAIFDKCRAYLQGEDMANLVNLFENIHKSYEINESLFKGYGNPIKHKRMMLFGFRQFALDVPVSLCDTLKSSLGHHFDQSTKMVNCPCGFTTDSCEEITAEYVDANEQALKKGVRALILNFIRYFKPTEFKVSVIDYIHYNADVLGPLGVFANGKGFMDKVAVNPEQLKQSVAILADYYRKIDAKIGAITVYQYNQQKPEDRLPLRILIINKQQDHFSTFNDSNISYLVNNAERFGLTVINMVKSTDGGSKETDREKKHLSGSPNRIRIISDRDGRFYMDSNNKWLDSPDTLPADFVKRVIENSQLVQIGTKYFSRFSMKAPVKSDGKRRPITIPFAIDGDDKTISCTFENDLFAAYIMGAAGSGKSTLLHTIISGLIMNYHPDEVELWLMDFKMLEFKRYANHMPPHVKYILLEKSEDLVFDIIDKLTELLEKREFLFSQKGWYKLTDVPADANIPAVFVIIDEFAQMSQILNETKGSGVGSDYTIKLENLLTKGRALGFKFIFASQTYTTGITGLTETACKQIQMRFALKNTPLQGV